MIASLPMYDRPSLASANAEFWAIIRDRLRMAGMEAPEELIPAGPDLFKHWEAADLVLSQTCGMPYRTRLHRKVTLVGTPDYGLRDCPAGHYRSVILTRPDDPRDTLTALSGARLAYNEAGSQSGWAALANDAPEVLTGPFVRCGSHAAAADAVAQGKADFAAIDAVTWRFLKREGAAPLRVVYETPPTPGLPLITARGNDPDILFDSVAAAISRVGPKNALGLRGIVRIPAQAYLAVPTPQSPAQFAR